jgi:hypothetical protein
MLSWRPKRCATFCAPSTAFNEKHGATNGRKLSDAPRNF